MMARTPGNARALEVSIRRILAWGNGLRRTLPQINPGNSRSAVYVAFPETLAGPSTRPTGLPTSATLTLFSSYCDRLFFQELGLQEIHFLIPEPFFFEKSDRSGVVWNEGLVAHHAVTGPLPQGRVDRP